MSMHGGFMGRVMSDGENRKKIRDTDWGAWRSIAGYMKGQTWRFVAIVLMTLVTAAVDALSPYLSKVALDDFILKKNISGLHLLLLAYLILYGIYWLASYVGSRLTVDTGQRLVARVRRDLFGKVLSLSQDFHDAARTGDLLSRLTNDVDALKNFVTDGLLDTVGDLLSLAGIIAMMFALNAKLAAVVLVTAPIIFFGIFLLSRHMRKAYGDVQEKVGQMSAGAEEDLSGIRVIQSLSREGDNEGAFETLNRENLMAHIKATVISALFFPFVSLTGILGMALILLMGGLMIISGEPGVSVGLIAAFIGYANRFFMPLRNMSQLLDVWQRAAASFERIYCILRAEPSVKPPAQPLPFPGPVRGEIRLEGVTFAYEPDRPILHGLNLALPVGSTTALVGPTGAGKSTLVKLLARLYDPGEGRITIDGMDLRDLDPRELRAAVMLVSQDVFLFSGTILDNIRYGDPAADDSAVIRAAELSSADTFIRGLPEGYHTEAGEGGVKLSGGQRQLIAFARAILADRPILILDEATSSVDAATEALIQRALETLLKGRTSIIIAHRFTTLRRAEKVLVLSDGEVVGYDSHEALLESCPLYRTLYEKQWVAGEKGV